jgi:sigma-B regulation protein RsbU (phosphoserine phosphatase)
LGLLVADVSDKGIPAALFMALTRTLVRAAVYDTPSPAEVLRRVNALIIPDNRQGMFVTAVYGVLSLESGEFTYANAGHNPPIFSCRKGQAIEFLPRTGAALGVIEELAMKECTIRFDPGDCLLLYTDGLTEAFSPAGEIYGEERMCQVFRANVSVAVRDLLDAMEASVDAFMGPLPASDDMTMLSVRKIPK